MHAFRIKFKTCESYGINCDSNELLYEINRFNCDIKLTTNGTSSLKNAKYLYVSANGLNSYELAQNVCNTANNALITTSALLDLGFDVPRFSPKSYWGKRIVEDFKNEGTILHNDNFGTTIYEYEEGQTIRYGGFSGNPVFLCNVNKFNEYFISCLEKGKIDERVLLGLKIINETRLMHNILARYVLIMSCIECVANRLPVSSVTKTKINELLKIIKDCDEWNEKQNLMSALGKLKKESISQACYRTISDVLGDEKGQEFKYHYVNRSKIIHEGIVPKDLDIECEEPKLRNLIIEFYKKLIGI